MANFTDFNYNGAPGPSDLVVGYKSDASAEQRTTVNDLLSTGLGYNSIWSPNQGSVAIGPNNSNQISNLSFAQGDDNYITGFYSSALGFGNDVTDAMAFAQGASNIVKGETSSALGDSNCVEGQSSHATGNNNVVSDIFGHAEGYRNYTGGYSTSNNNFGASHAEGYSNIVAVPYAHAQGVSNRIGYAKIADWYANNPPRIGFGFQAINSVSDLNILNINSPTLSSSVRLFFTDDTGTNTYTARISSINLNYNDPYAGGPACVIFLKNETGDFLPNFDYFGLNVYCTPITAYDGSTNNSNIGAAAHAEGIFNIAAGNYAHAQGYNNTAAGNSSHTSGRFSSTGESAMASHAMGDTCYANGIRSFALGYKTVANDAYSYVWNGNPNIPAPGFLYSTASGQYIVNAPGGIYLSGAPVAVQGIIQQGLSNNIINDSNVYVRSGTSSNGPLSGGITLGYLNSAFDGYGFRSKSISSNIGTSINGYANLVDSAATDVNGLNNYVVADGSNVKGVCNVTTYFNSSVEGAVNTIGRIYTIAKTVSATNTIHVFENFSGTSNAQGFLPVGAKVLIDGYAGNSGTIVNAQVASLRKIFTVASVSPDLRSFTVVEPITALGSNGAGYTDDAPYSDRRYVVAIASYVVSNNTNVQGSHAEGIYNYSLGRASHAEGQNNAATGAASHAEGIGNYATTICHAEGLDTRSGYNIFYWDSYNAATNSFQLFTNSLSSLNSADVSSLNAGNILFLISSTVGATSTRRNVTRIPVLSADPVANTITAVSAVFADNVTSLGFTRDRQLLIAVSNSTHTEGYQTVARGTGSHAEGIWTMAQGIYSHAAGKQASAKHDYAYAWSSGSGSSTSLNFETTRAEQYAISANGGVYIPGSVGIGTDSIANALTVAGNISAKGVLYAQTISAANMPASQVPQNLILNSLSADSVTTSYDQAPFVGNYWPLDNPRNTSLVGNNLSASVYKAGRYSMYNIIPWLDKPTLIIEETSNNKFVQGDVVSVCGYHREGYIAGKTENNPLRIFYKPFGGTASFIYSLTGSSSYDNGYVFLTHTGTTFLTASDQNLSIMAGQIRIEKGQPQDPGTPFSALGRGRFVHGLNLEAGDPKFTNGSDHFHLIQTSQSAPGWQKINGGNTQYPQIITEHTLAFRANFASTSIVAANTTTLQAADSAPYGVLIPGVNYASLWLSSNLGSSLNVGKIVYFSVSNTGDTFTSLRNLGFTAATYPAKVVHSGAIGSAQSNADIPAGYTLPNTAQWHIRVEPYNLSPDNWNNAGGSFSDSINNSGEVVRTPSDPLIAPNTVSSSVSAIGGYDTVSVENNCEVVLNFTSNPLTSASQKFLYEGLPVILLVSDTTTLSADNYSNNLATKTGYGIKTSNNEFTGERGSYKQTVYDGYIYRTTANKVIVRVGITRGLEESRLGTHEAPDFNWFRERPWPLMVSNINLKTLTLTLTSNYNDRTTISLPELNGERLLMSPGYPNDGGMGRYGLWSGRDAFLYTVPKTIKSQLELVNFSALSSSNKEIYIYSGNKDPVHRPVPGLQTWFFERYPTYQPDLKETGGVVSRFAIGPSCEGLKKDTGVVGFGSTCYHEKSMAIGHKAETTENNQVVIAADNSIMRLGNTSLLTLLSGTSNTDSKNVYEITSRGDTKQSGFNIRSNSCIAGAGSNQATATPITTDVVTVTGGANNSGVILPVTNGGHFIQIWNYAGGATTIYIYPNTGGIIKNQALATNAPYTNFTGEGNYTYITSISANTWIIA